MKEKGTVIYLVTKICDLSRGILEHPPSSSMAKVMRRPISNRRKTRLLFRHFLAEFSYQATSDQAVDSYRAKHGDVTFEQIALQMEIAKRNSDLFCPRLESFEAFKGCGYRKAPRTCNNPILISSCPLATHDMMKGVLNQKAYSFYLFLRDVCHGDIITHTESTIAEYANLPSEAERIIAAKDNLLKQFVQLFGLGSKLANMSLSSFLMADSRRTDWVNVGRAMVAVDSLVHNFLHRTGILGFYDSDHPYGPACYVKCIKAIEEISKEIDCTRFSEAYPSFFPRFIQLAIWRFCTVGILDVCNGKNVKNGRCMRKDQCPVYDLCDRLHLS